MICDHCGILPGRPQRCNGDGGSHHHGRVHTFKGGLAWLCDECHRADGLKWNHARSANGESSTSERQPRRAPTTKRKEQIVRATWFDILLYLGACTCGGFLLSVFMFMYLQAVLK